jgi:hypothetical protein
LGRHRYASGAEALGVITKGAMAKYVLQGNACTDYDNGPSQGSSLCFSDGTS